MVQLTQTQSIVLLVWICLFLLLGIRGFQNELFVEQVEVEKSQSQESQLASDPRKNTTVASSSSDASSFSLDDPVVGNCSSDFFGHKPVMDEITVLPMTNESPTILCYILCTLAYHERVQIIRDTWGSRCDGFFVASDTNDKALGAVAIPAMNHPHTREYLWDKQRETIRYLYQHNISQHYDWTFKADTDTYAIIDNLKAHLSTMTADLSIPQLVGHKLFLPERVRARHGMLSPEFSKYFEKQDQKDRWMFVAGGGYAMNQKFVEAMATSLDTSVGCRSMKNMGEDVGTAFCVASKYPLSLVSSRDENGREMFHLHPPRQTYHLSESWWPDYHPSPYSPAPPIGNESCSRHSILFHGLKKDDRAFYWMHNQLYSCRQ